MKIKFVAEVSSNHNKNIKRCLAFIDKAAEIGCDAVKFQLFRIKELFAPEALTENEELRLREAWELPIEFLPAIAKHCREVKIQFACTPFYLEAVKKLLPYVDFYKIASYELLRKDLLKTCAQTGRPVVLSTGMATMNEVKAAADILKEAGCKDLTLLHCVSGYPTQATECNLAAIATMRNEFKIQDPKFKIKFGWSDHSVSPGVIYRAIHCWKAEMIEFHFDLDGTGKEYKTGHCWLPDQVLDVIKTVKSGILADGNGRKIPVKSEINERKWRADPIDGLRPIKKTRAYFKN